WRDMTWQAKADNEGLKQRLWDLKKALEQAREDKRDIREVTTFVPFSLPWLPKMTRQYQELQKQTAARSQRLEAKVKSLQEELDMCPLLLSLYHTATRLQESRKTQETATQALAERDRTIAQLQGKLYVMEREYEKILHVSGDMAVGHSPWQHSPPSSLSSFSQGSLDLVLAKMAEASQHWEEVGTTIAVEHKECLQEFGLNPLEM
ncbi:CC153 protein, partial [Cepphus grylle]|nr:CC153 protein [Cepphus grylle]